MEEYPRGIHLIDTLLPIIFAELILVELIFNFKSYTHECSRMTGIRHPNPNCFASAA